MEIDLNELERLAKAATPGKWTKKVGWKAPALISVKQEAYEAGGA